MELSGNKKTIETYIDGFQKSDHSQILSCLTEDVVVLEGKVKGVKADGTTFAAAFCDVFELENSKIKRLIGYIAVV